LNDCYCATRPCHAQFFAIANEICLSDSSSVERYKLCINKYLIFFGKNLLP